MAGKPGKWDLETEVLVVGSGGAAMAAAILAHDNGANVTVIERSDKVGGTSAMSDHQIAPCVDQGVGSFYLISGSESVIASPVRESHNKRISVSLTNIANLFGSVFVCPAINSGAIFSGVEAIYKVVPHLILKASSHYEMERDSRNCETQRQRFGCV